MTPVIPQQANDWLRTTNPSQALGSFPPNLAVGLLPLPLQQEIMSFMFHNYVWPQVMERQVFEPMWQKLLDMYRIKMDKIDLSLDEQSPAGRDAKEDKSGSGPNVRLADSVMYDAVERLTDVTHFISWKDGSPIQYNIPQYFDTRSETAFYHPFRDKIQAANALLQWNIDNEEIYSKHLTVTRHFYTYGLAFMKSEFIFNSSQVQRMLSTGQQAIFNEVNKIGTSFEPISIWKIWLNWRLNANEMEYQPCPFFFEETPRFATLQNQYNPASNPFGFGNLDRVAEQAGPAWLYTEPEMSGLRQQLEKVPRMDNQPQAMPQLLESKHSVEALWTFYPMLPLDPTNLAWKVYPDGTPVPLHRYLVQSWGQNLMGKQIMLRIQRNFYPRDILPLYGAAHMPDLDSGLYSPSLGYLLWNHYREIVTCKQQYITNKERINNPPQWVLANSPANKRDLTSSGVQVEVNSKNDFGYADVTDGTGTTVNFMQMLREQAKTASKSDDAILGKALGGRTSATEAQNVFQASMSALTTPINLFNYHIMGGFATRVWEYSATWFPPGLLKAITGQMGFILSPEDLWVRVGMKWDVASTYIESIVRQQNIRYMLESSMGDPTINRAPMWKALLREWRFDNADEWVNDGGFEKEVYKATDQACRAFLGEQVIIDPDQNHSIAIEVKKAFLEDQKSVWMQKYPDKAPLLIQQIIQHQQLLMLQMQMQMAMRKANAPLGDTGGADEVDNSTGGQQPPLANPAIAASGGAVTQQNQTRAA